MFFAIGRCKPALAAVVGTCWAFVSAVGVTYWLPDTVANYYHQPYWLGATMFLTATLCMVAFEYTLFAYAASRLQRARLGSKSLAIAAAWVVAEFGRARLLTGNPWAFSGYSQSGSVSLAHAGSLSLLTYAPLQIVQVADLAGVYGVSFVTAVVNAAIAQILLQR